MTSRETLVLALAGGKLADSRLSDCDRFQVVTAILERCAWDREDAETVAREELARVGVTLMRSD